jgi:hypothetical protein
LRGYSEDFRYFFMCQSGHVHNIGFYWKDLKNQYFFVLSY